MTDYTSLQAKVNDLKAKVDSNSISPSYVGALLDDFISIIKSSDQEEDVAAALQNAATALTLARSSSTKADNARATAGLAANKCQLALDNYASVKDATDIVNCCLADMLDCGWFCPPSLDDLNAGYGTRVLNEGGTLKLDYPASAPEHVVWLDGPDEPLKSTDYSVEFEFQSSLALSDLSVMLFDNSMTCYKWDNNDPFIRSEVGAYSANEWHRVSIDMAKYIALTGWNQDKSGERLRINFNNIPASGEAVSISIKNIRVYHNQEVKAPEGTDLNTFAGKAKLTSTLIKAIDEAADEELKKAIEGIKNGKVDKVTGKGLSTNDYTDADKAKLTALPTNTQLTEKIDEAKLALFIDQWNAACGIYGKYNADTGYFELNGLVDITYKEAVLIYANRRKVSLENFGFYAQYKGRTNLMPWVDNGHFNYSLGMEYMFSNCTNMEVARVNTDDRHVVTPTSMFRMFIYCGKLRKVLGVLNVTATTQIQQAFEGCAQLQEVQIRGLKIDLSLSDSPLLSLDSLSYLVAQSAASKPITVTVHPEVYAKLTATEHSAQARSNLALNSDVPVTSANYPMKQYPLNTVVKTGDALTITVWGTPSEGSYLYAAIENCRVEGNLVEISPGVWQKTFVLKDEKATAPHLNIYNNPNNRLEGHIDKVKICYGLDPSPQWSAPVEMPTAPEAIEAIGWERVMLMAAAKNIAFATTE